MKSLKQAIAFQALLSGLAIFSSVAQAEKLAVTAYFREAAKPGTEVCELVDKNTNQANCYVIVNWSKELRSDMPKEDGVDLAAPLQKFYMSKPENGDEGQGQFHSVRLHELAASISPGVVKQREARGEKIQKIDVYVKLDWKGEKAGPLKLPLEGQHIVRGVLKTDPDTGRFQFELISIPDLTMIGQFNPNLAVTAIFGRNAMKHSYELEHDVKAWMQTVINSVLPAVYSDVAVQPRR